MQGEEFHQVIEVRDPRDLRALEQREEVDHKVEGNEKITGGVVNDHDSRSDMDRLGWHI